MVNIILWHTEHSETRSQNLSGKVSSGLQYRSGPAFYSLPGHNFTKRKIMTGDHAVVTSMSSMSPVSFMDNVSIDKHALHDIRYKFKVDNIWATLTT